MVDALSLVLVNAALIFHRRNYPHINRPFRVADRARKA
jgi:CBS-domain-containing membrane protein